MSKYKVTFTRTFIKEYEAIVEADNEYEASDKVLKQDDEFGEVKGEKLKDEWYDDSIGVYINDVEKIKNKSMQYTMLLFFCLLYFTQYIISDIINI